MSGPIHRRRPRHPMPPYVEAALLERGLMDAYRSRPAYQQNDYIGWIAGAKRPETRDKRLAQMLDELAGGDRYMNMAWKAREQRSARHHDERRDQGSNPDIGREDVGSESER